MRRSLATILAVALAAVTALGIAGPAGSADAATRIPVVFVHGYGGNASNWTTAESVFEAGGYSSSQLFAYQYDTTQSNKTSAAELNSYITNVLVQTGASQVDIVNHSMGGLVSDWYIKELGGQPYVRHLASLAGANHGTTSASACTVYPSCVEMLPGSAFIQTVTSGDETPGATRYATWYSPCDGVITPYTSTELNGATNNYVACETHLGYLTDTAILTQVRTFLGT